MYFEIENTPEHVRRARSRRVPRPTAPVEECPRLVLAPFSRPPQLVFDDVLVGSSCEKSLEIFNPSKQMYQVELARAPPGLLVALPAGGLALEPQSFRRLALRWTPAQPTATRETVRFTTDNRGRFDVILVLKSTLNSKSNQTKGYKISPGKMKKKSSKRSPASVYKKKCEAICNFSETWAAAREPPVAPRGPLRPSNKENVSPAFRADRSADSYYHERCPFDSPTRGDFNFDTSEIFSNMRRPNKEVNIRNTYDMRYGFHERPGSPRRAPADMFDDLTFTPLRLRAARLDHGPQIIMSLSSSSEPEPEPELDDSLERCADRRTALSTTAAQPPPRRAAAPPAAQPPTTSSPKGLSSPNFSINTEFSRISDLSFAPQRFSMERKLLPRPCDETHSLADAEAARRACRACGDSPAAAERLEVPPCWGERPRTAFDDYQQRSRSNAFEPSVRQSHVAADARPSLSPPPPLQSIPEESDRQAATFTVERTPAVWAKRAARADPGLWSAAGARDPFLAAGYLYDEEAVRQLEREFERWLNHMLTPPAELEEAAPAPVPAAAAPLPRAVPAAPTREALSAALLGPRRLPALRRAARALLAEPDTALALRRLRAHVDAGRLAVRADRNLHLDVGLQRAVLELLLCYNPLWLRVGLEALYDEPLPLRSNNDLEGLAAFLRARLFRNPRLRARPSAPGAAPATPNVLAPGYVDALKKFTLKKLFTLVLLLDRAKCRRLIAHDPCLFRRNAPVKESRELLTRLTRELLAGAGDIARQLRPLGCGVQHRQGYLDEYRYAVHNLAADLRDGVRLARVLELVLLRADLLPRLRVPAVSRLQKVHNVQVSLDALRDAGLTPHGDITAADVADGHREKTLSLLWQLTRVLRAPLFERAAGRIQAWWRDRCAPVLAERRARRTAAASVLQRCWRARLGRARLRERHAAATKVQACFRMHVQRRAFLALKAAVRTVEARYAALLSMRSARRGHLALRAATVLVQARWRGRCARVEAGRRRGALVRLQRWARALMAMRRVRVSFLALRAAALVLQSWLRARRLRQQYVRLRGCTLVLQVRWRGARAAHLQRACFLRLRAAAVLLQRCWRARTAARRFHASRRAALALQAWWRGLRARREYVRVRRACLTVQAMFRARAAGHAQRLEFLAIRAAVVSIQIQYRARARGKAFREWFIRLRATAVLVQRRIRARAAGRAQRLEFLAIRAAAVSIQIHYRARARGKAFREWFIRLRAAAVLVQRRIRARALGRAERARQRAAVIAALVMQRAWRARAAGRAQRLEFLAIRAAVVSIQIQYRARAQGKAFREWFIRLRAVAVLVQRRIRARALGRAERARLRATVVAALVVQRAWRARAAGRAQRLEFLAFRAAAVSIQSQYRARAQGKSFREWFIRLRAAAVLVQRRIRARALGRAELARLRAAVVVQRAWRARRAGRCARASLEARCTAATTLQRWWRNKRAARITRALFHRVRAAALFCQRRARGVHCRRRYLALRRAALVLQAAWRTRQAHRRFAARRAAAVLVQRQFRARRDERRLRAVVCIQRRVRGHLARTRFLALRTSALVVQRAWRDKLATQQQRCTFLQLRRAAIRLQVATRAWLARRRALREVASARATSERRRRHDAAARIQALFRGGRVRAAAGTPAATLRARWRAGALVSAQPSLGERHEEAMAVLRGIADIETVIHAFRSLELLTEVFPALYASCAAGVARRVHVYMAMTNRSISSVEVLKSAGAVLANLARYPGTGPAVYARERVGEVLRFLRRYNATEPRLFCVLATQLWLLAKYEPVRQDLTEFLNLPENKKMLVDIKRNVERMKRMADNSRRPASPASAGARDGACGRGAPGTPPAPALEPDYGIARAGRPRYFADPHHAINTIFHTFRL